MPAWALTTYTSTRGLKKWNTASCQYEQGFNHCHRQSVFGLVNIFLMSCIDVLHVEGKNVYPRPERDKKNPPPPPDKAKH